MKNGTFRTRRAFIQSTFSCAGIGLLALGTGCTLAPSPGLTSTTAPVEPKKPSSDESGAPTSAPATPTLNPERLTPAASPTASGRNIYSTRLTLLTNLAAVEAPWYKKSLAKLSERYPLLKVEHENVAADYLDIVPTRAASGTLPDVLQVRAQHSAAWAFRKWLVDLGDLVRRDSAQIGLDDLWPAQRADQSGDGRWLFWPHELSVCSLFGRRDLLELIKLDPTKTPLTTGDYGWDDLFKIAREIPGRSRGQTPPAGRELPRWGFRWYPDATAMAGVFSAESGKLIGADGASINLASAENAKLLQCLADLANVDGAAPKPGEAGSEGFFAQGKLAFEVGNSAAVASYRAGLPQSAKIRQFSSPKGASGKRAGIALGSGWAISRDSRDRLGAWELIKHLTSKDSQELLLSLPIRNLPARASASALWGDGLRSLDLFDNPEFFLTIAREAVSLRSVPWWLDYQDAYSELMPEVWLGKRKAAEALPEIEKRVNEAAKRFV